MSNIIPRTRTSRRRVKLVTSNPRGVYTIAYDPTTGRTGKARWLPDGTIVEEPTSDDWDGRGFSIRAYVRPIRGRDSYIGFEGMYLLPGGECVVCYGCTARPVRGS
jgi:hypothetical protein